MEMYSTITARGFYSDNMKIKRNQYTDIWIKFLLLLEENIIFTHAKHNF